VIFALKTYVFQHLTLESIRANEPLLRNFYSAHRVETVAIFFLLYLLISTVAFFPGAIILALAAGAVFEFWVGLLVVSLASTVGALVAFLVARFFFREYVQAKFSRTLAPINLGIRQDGPFYLLFLRLTPVFPYFAVNLCMALTPISVWNFVIFSEIGMLPGSAAFVNAGRQLSLIQSMQDAVSPATIASFALLGLLPLLARLVFRALRRT
jgi:uncharacterized membrane protein YdjX (TVP38/TMEM64 family)